MATSASVVTATTAIYVLALERGRFFVGASDDPEKEFQRHREGLGPAWTNFYRPMRIHAIYSSVPTADAIAQIRTRMRQLAQQHGLDLIRGGPWDHVRLNDMDRQEIMGHDETTMCILS